MKRLKQLRSGLTYQTVRAVVLLLLVFNLIVSTIGFVRFTNSLTKEYTDAAFRTADSAATLVDAGSIDRYLSNGGINADYQIALSRMQVLCNKQDATLLYVIDVDTSDYGRFASVFNTVNSQSGFKPWKVGYVRETTNEEYRQIYRDMYENGLERAVVTRTSHLAGNEPHITALVPIKKTDGTVRAILCVQRPMSELKSGRWGFLTWIVVTAVVLMVISASIATYYLKRNVTGPIRKIADEASRFAAENSAGEEGALTGLSNTYEVQTLAESIDKMEHDTLHYIDNLTTVTAEKERIGTELQVAKEIQEGELPSIFPPFPDRTEFDIFASMTPAKEIGGDFYDFFLLDEDHIALVMADVSGKGVPAALFMMVTKILLHERAVLGGTPGEVLTFVNERLLQNNKADMFVTLWFGILEIPTGRILAANAGHEDPAVGRKGQRFELVKTKHGPIMGAIEGVTFRDTEIVLGEGDKLFLYTDGVPEATDANDKLFTLDRMVAALNDGADADPRGVLDAVQRRVDAFVGDAPQFDDLTMLCLEWYGKK